MLLLNNNKRNIPTQDILNLKREIPIHSLLFDYLFYSKSLRKKRQKDLRILFIEKIEIFKEFLIKEEIR